MTSATIGDLQRMVGWYGVACYLVGSFVIGYWVVGRIIAVMVWIAQRFLRKLGTVSTVAAPTENER